MALEEFVVLNLRLPLLACVAASLLAGCDTGEPDAAQAALEPKLEPQAALTGALDRSFVGERIPEVLLRDPDGNTLALASLADGKPTLINLWATWCAPCVLEMPLLDRLAGEMAGRLRVITVSEDLRGAEVVVPFFEERGLANLPRWMDEENTLAFSYGGGAVLPLTILYDGQGREVWRVIGAYDWGSAKARQALDEAIGQGPLASGA